MPKSESFLKLEASVKGFYLGKKVPFQYRQRYGKVYGKKDVKSVSYAIAKSRKIRID